MRRPPLALCALWTLLLATGASAAESPTLLSGYNLTSWTQKDGPASPLIWSVAQDNIGYLWLGTDAGALRFDGVRFVPWDTLAPVPNPSSSVRSLCVSRDGTIWFGLGEHGGIVALRNGVARSYGTRAGLPEGIVMGLAETADGTLWAGIGNMSGGRSLTEDPCSDPAAAPPPPAQRRHRSGERGEGRPPRDGVVQSPAHLRG